MIQFHDLFIELTRVIFEVAVCGCVKLKSCEKGSSGPITSVSFSLNFSTSESKLNVYLLKLIVHNLKYFFSKLKNIYNKKMLEAPKCLVSTAQCVGDIWSCVTSVAASLKNKSSTESSRRCLGIFWLFLFHDFIIPHSEVVFTMRPSVHTVSFSRLSDRLHEMWHSLTFRKMSALLAVGHLLSSTLLFPTWC